MVRNKIIRLNFVIPHTKEALKNKIDELKGTGSYGDIIVPCLEYLFNYPELIHEIVERYRKNSSEVQQEQQVTPEPIVETVVQEENDLNTILIGMTSPA